MNLKKLLKDITDNDILLDVQDGELQVFANGPEVDVRLIGEIKAHREELVAFLSSNDQTDENQRFSIPIPAVPQAQDYALSSAQRRLWILSQTTGANIAYIMARAYLFEGELDPAGLDYALNQLLERHESLRTVFKENEQREVRQYIHAPREMQFPLISVDLRNVENAEENVKELVQREMTREFALSEGLLVRAALFRLSEERYVFSYAMHHIIGDGWSMSVLIRELLHVYNAYIHGEAVSLRPLSIQYRDYAAWQLHQLEANRLKEHRAYWFRQFEGELPVLDLPGDRRRPAVKTYNGGTVSRIIDAREAERLKQLGREQGATLFMTLLAVVKALLFRYTGQEDMIVGSPIAGREHIDLEDQIGFYVNMLALRTRFSGTASFRHLLERVKDTTLDAYGHQAYPFDELVHEGNLGTDTSRHPLFDVVVVLQNTGTEADRARTGKAGKLTIHGYGETERVVSLFDLRIDFREMGDELLTTIDYNSDIYNRSMIERLADHLKRFIGAVSADPDKSLHQVDYLSVDGSRYMPQALADGHVGYPELATITGLFESQVERTPDAMALTYEGIHLTYSELNQRANRIAHFLLKEARLQREDGVGLLLDRKPDMIAAMIGVLKAGGMYVPLDTGTPEERLKFMVNDTGMKVLLTEKAFMERVNRLQWSSRALTAWLCVDSLQVYEEKEQEENVMMNQELWDHVGQRATDQITGGGWISSYTGQPIPAIEMEEYALNIYKKLSPLLRPGMRVLEIGCSSGLTLNKIAPRVALFYGTDLSPVILERTRSIVAERSLQNVKLKVLAAHDIAGLDEKDFDLIIMNSVIQHFHGHNYLRKVIKDAIGLLSHRGRIFIGDIMDIERKEDLVADLLAFKAANRDKGFSTKTDFSADLFVAKDFFRDLMLDEPSIVDVEVGDKLFTIANELTKFRYDVLLGIDKGRGAVGEREDVADGESPGEGEDAVKGQRKKYQFGNGALLRQSICNPGLEVLPGNLAYVIYTSGTTGRPKGVMVQHDNVVRLFKTDRPLFDFNERDVWSLFHSCSFDFSVWEIYGALLFGGRLVVVPRKVAQDTPAYRALLAEQGVTILNQTPSAFYNLIKQEPDEEQTDLQLRYVIFGGEALSPGRLEEWRKRYPRVRLINMYGITETTVHVTYKEIGEREIGSDVSNIGRPIPTLYCYVLDRYLNPLPVGLPGELYVGGKGVARAYLNRPELTAQRFVPDPFRQGERLYRSGDKVRILENGEMEYMGRTDDQVKIRGYRVEVAEIQHHLDQHQDIDESVVLVKEDDHGQKNLVAYIVSKGELTITDLRDYLLTRLPDYMVPAYFVAVDRMPLTSNGKVNKKALPHPEGLSLSTGVRYVAPRNRLENDLVRLFAAILGIGEDGIGIRDNFFSLGGDSIKAMRLVMEVKKQLQAVITIGIVYKHQCVQELAGSILESKGQDSVMKDLAAGLRKVAGIGDLIRQENETAQVLPLHYEDIYPVSRIEQGMIYSSQLNSAEPVYYDQFLFRLYIRDYGKFLDALAQMVRRHPILRTLYFTKSFSVPAKVVLPEIDVPIEFEDISLMSPEEQTAYVDQIVRRDQEVRLAFDNELFWRLKIFLTGGTAYSILWSFHHALLDGWSVSVFCKELTDLLSDGGRVQLPALPYSYKDYCAILSGRERSEAIEKYWKDLLGGYSRNKLPFNYKGSKINEGRGMKYVSRRVGDSLLRELIRLVSEHQLSFKAVCIAAHIYLLHIICSEPEVITGVVTHERPELENSEYILGCFLNTIPIRIDVRRQETILSLLREVNRFLTDVKPYEVHLSEIARILEEKATTGNPIFDTILNYTDFHLYRDLSKETGIHSAVGRGEEPEAAPVNQMTNTLFDVEVGKTLDSFWVNIKYVPSYFNIQDVENALDLYVRILEYFARDVHTPLRQLDLVSGRDLQAIVHDFNATTTAYSRTKTLQTLFEEQVARTPDAVALRQDGAQLSYALLNRKANQLAGFLSGRGVNPGENIGLLVTRSFDMIVGMLGILKAGAAYVPIDPQYPVDRQAYIAENSKVRAILVDDDYPVADMPADYQVIFMREAAEASVSPYTNPELRAGSAELAYTIYTSGSTGRPKGVMIEHHSAVNLIEWVNRTFGIGPGDRLLFITSMCFDLSVYDIFGILSAGGMVVVASQEQVRDTRELRRLLTDERITFWDSVPTTLNYLVGELEADEDAYVQHSLRTVFLSGDWIPVHLPDRTRKFFPEANIISLGGATEGTVWSNFYPTGLVDPSWSSIPYGRPIQNNSFYILDDHLRPVPGGVAGELYIGGVGVARGYANDEEKTVNSFKTDPFHKEWGGRMYKTGDLGRLMPDGNMEFLGRKDNQVKIRGYRVELGEIESMLCKIEPVKEAIVNTYRDINNNNQLVAYLVLSGAFEVQAIKTGLRGFLPDYMVPNQYILMEALPLNSNGKIDRKALPRPAEDGPQEKAKDYTAPADELEIKLAQIWKSILSIDRMSMKDDFFDLGANSLSVGAFINRVHRETDLQLTIREVFSNPTLEGVVHVLRERSSTRFEFIRPVVTQTSYPLSSYQRQFWVLSQFEENNLSYHIPGVYVFEGQLDIHAFEQSLGTLIARHEIMRTVFKEDGDGEVRQWVRTPEEASFRLVHKDLRHEDNQEGKVRQILNQQFVTPFDLSRGPLIRAELIRWEERKWVFAYTLHHIISDGWSIGLLIRELLTLYNAAVNGDKDPLPPMRIQYKDYASWQQQQMSDPSSASHRSYWIRQLAGEVPVLNMPTDRPRPAVKTFNGSTLFKYIEPAPSIRFNDLVRELGATLFMGLVGILNVLLFRYTHQEDMIIGSPVAGRDHADLENQIGCYVNTLPLRSRFSANDSFRKLLMHVRQMTLEGYAHQVYPFDELAYDLQLQREISRGGLFDVMVVLQNTQAISGAGNFKMGALEVMGYDVSENINSKFDLVFDFVETGKGILARIEYNTDIYNKETIRRMADHLEQLMSAVVAAPDISIGGLDFLSGEEKDQLLIGFNDTGTEYRSDSTIARLFQEQVERSPDAPAIIFGAEIFTYRELDRWAGRLGGFLQNKYAIGPDDAVGIKLERSPWLIVAVLAILKAGGACVVVDTGYPAERIDYILGDSRCKTLIDESILAQFRADPDPVALAAGTTGLPGQLSFIVYTSGSTGNPKGCMLTHKGVINHLFNKIRLLDLSYGDVICHCSAFHFVGGIWQLLAPLITGGKVVVCTAEELRDIGRLLAIAHSHEARILEIIPSQLNEYLSHEETIRLQSITTLILTGEKLSGHFVRKCYAGNDRVTIFNTYGQTELSDVTTCYRIPKEIIDENILAGRPIQNTAHYILSPSGALCPVGVIGEICTSGDGMALGYINDEVLTAGKFVDNPFRPGHKMYRTGDLGRWLSGGVLEVAGRKDEQVKIRGFRVELREIEEALLQHPGIEEAAVLNLGKTGGEARLVAFLVGKTRLSASAVRAFLMGKVPAYMMPASYVQLESFPLLDNGKTHKKALAQFAGLEMESGVEYIAPKSDVECRLTAIWEEILQRGNIGVRDNFFEMGGHSLKATVMMIRIKHAFDVRLSLRDIFQYATVQKLSEEIEKQLWMQESRSTQQETSDSRDIIKI